MEHDDQFLPKELETEILLRLPAISLIRFKCVCKSWCSTINSHSFSTQLLFHQNDNDNNSSNRYLLLDTTNFPLGKTTRRLSYHTLRAVQTLCPAIDPKLGKNYYIACACNGLVLFRYFNIETKWGLWNPTNGHTKLLPPSSSPDALNLKKSHNDISYRNVGFGFDNKTMDYKVIMIYMTGGTVVLEMYSLKSNSWATIPISLHGGLIIITKKHCHGVFNNGMLSWKAIEIRYKEGVQDQYDGFRHVIISLNLSCSETIVITPLPPGTRNLPFGKFNYPVLYEESLALVDHLFSPDRSAKSFDIWVLGEYGVKESWKKLFSVGPLQDVKRILGFWKDGKVFIETFYKAKFIRDQVQNINLYENELLLLDIAT